MLPAGATSPPYDASFSYAKSSYLNNEADPTPTITGTSGGTFRGDTGLIFVDSGSNSGSSTGQIDLSASTVKSYSITYEVGGVSSNFALSIVQAFVNTYSMLFDGVDDEMVIPYNSSLQFGKTDSYSVSCWIYSSTYLIASKKIFGTGTYATAAYLGNGTYSGGLYSVFWRMGGVWPTSAGYFMSVDSGFTLSPSTWYNIIITYDGSELGTGLKMYINGAAPIVSTTSWGANAQNSINSNDFTISLATTTGWPGNIDEISVWRSELTSTHVGEVYNSGSPNNLDSLATTPAPTYWNRMGD